MYKKILILLIQFIFYNLAFCQSITLDNSLSGVLINKAGIGLDVSDGFGNKIGTSIRDGKAILQSHSDLPLLFRTNSSLANQVYIYDNKFKIGPSIFGYENFGINYGRLKFTGSKAAGISSGIEFTNTSGTALRGFFGMADNGLHLGLWGYGNNSWNIRMNVENGFLGIGNINPQARLHVNGTMKIIAAGFGSPLKNQILTANDQGTLGTKANIEIYTLASADITYKVGSVSNPVDTPYGLFFSSASSGTPTFYSNLVLPDEVALTEFDVVYVDMDNNYNLETCLIRNDLNGDNLTNLGCIITSGNDASRRKTNLIFPSSININNDAFQYNLRLRVLNPANTNTNWPAQNIKFYRSNFYYSY
jgi:hypothetical protein